jgi:hypothetical protein
MEPDPLSLVFDLGLVLMAVGLVLLFLMKVWPKVNGSPRAAVLLVGIGFGICVLDVAVLFVLLSTIVS